jgi:putative ABC transport system ATP-binding protein
LLYADVPRRERMALGAEALERVGLRDRMHHRPSELSSGQQQRVAIARAIVAKPLVILADEPTGNLDTHTSQEILGLFQQLGDEGMTIAYVTHEPDIARYASRLLVVRDGRIESDTRQDAARVDDSPMPGYDANLEARP